RFTLYKLHGVEVIVAGPSEVEDRGYVCVANAGCRTRLAQKAKPRRFITEITLVNDFLCHGAAQIDVERLVSDPHYTPTQFERFPVITFHQLVVVKSLRWLVWYRLKGIPRRRLAGLNPTDKTLTKHANRAEFHCSRKRVTT